MLFRSAPIEDTYRQYLADHSEIFKGREDKFVCLMDLALMAMRKLKKEGKLEDQEESEEINACSIVVPVQVDGVEEAPTAQRRHSSPICRMISAHR